MIVITVARKSLGGQTVAGNACAVGTGGLNIDASRIEGIPPSVPQPLFHHGFVGNVYGDQAGVGRNGTMSHAIGRWPANLILSESVTASFDKQTGNLLKQGAPKRKDTKDTAQMYGGGQVSTFYGDTGGASRFFKIVGSSR